jgi:hypothetical protein
MSKATDYLVEQIRNKDALIEDLLGQRSAIWDAGWAGLHHELECQKDDPYHPITNTNPYEGKA